MTSKELSRGIHELWKKSGWSEAEFLCEARVTVREKTDRLKICYHGTDEETAPKISREGFNPGTYFAEHLEDAIAFGGGYVFEVCFPQDTTSVSEWQFTTNERVPPDRIVRLRQVKFYTTVYEDKALGKRIFESNLEARKKEVDG